MTRKTPHIPVLLGGIAIVVCGILADMLTPARAWVKSTVTQFRSTVAQVRLLQMSDAEAAFQPTLPVDAGKTRARGNCDQCGVIQSTRRIAADGDAPAVYEITVRLGNGSTHVLSDTKPAKWRPGEQTVFIPGGSNPVR